ncbi:MAG: HEAT repeat domain-containing protein [Planctomycetota bacterium]
MNHRAALAGVLAFGAAGVALALPLLPPRALPCLDVGIPPGLPFEWEQPFRVPTESLYLKPREQELDPSATRVRQVQGGSSRPRVYTEKTTAMAYARVTTVDILNHFDWQEGPQSDLVKRPTGGRVPTGGTVGPEVAAPYPPPIPLDLYWVSFATWLRENLHPNQVSDAESIERLVEIGFPALCVLNDVSQTPVGKMSNGGSGYVVNAATAKTRLERWLKVLAKRVGPLPGPKPHAAADPKDPERSMLLRLAAEDLAGGYASSVDGTYAGRLLSLPAGEGLSLLLEYARPSVHTLLLRNAASLLGAYPRPEARAALIEVVKNAKDDVARLRAYMALARMGSPEAQRAAVERLKDVSPQAGVHVLGLLRAPEGVKHALQMLGKGDVEDKLVAIRALGRIGDGDKKVLKALERTFANVAKADPKKLYEVPAWRADNPDPVTVRQETLGQLCLVALGRLGDEGARKKVWQLLDRDPQAAAGPNARPSFNRDAVAAPGTFGAFTVPTLAFLVESLPLMGDGAKPYLERALKDKVCDVGLRLAAWRGLDALKGSTPELVVELTKDEQAAVRAEALGRWADVDQAKALERASSVLTSYNSLAWSGSIEVIAAADLLGRAGNSATLPRPATVIKRGAMLRDQPDPKGKLVVAVPIARVTVRGEPKGGWVQATYESRGTTHEGWIEVSFLQMEGGSPAALLGKALAQAKRPKAQGPGPKPLINGNPTLEVAYPVAEAVARALGRFDVKESREALLAYLGDDSQPASARGAVATALAGFKANKEVKQGLAKALADADGWVRYCAFRALRHQGAQAAFVDWIFGDAAAREPVAKALVEWAAR